MAANMYSASPPKPRGYPKLASLMGYHPETAIFRRFDHLNMLNLLSLQAELTHLEVRLQDIRSEDETSGDPLRMLHAVDFYEMRQPRREGHDLQWRLILELRAKLQEYSTIFVLRISLHAGSY